ncbi:MAG: outer-membrane lipoprotein carrier protein LolA, partial [Candidatus Margulisiibacteriota bacterium]
MRKVLVFSFAVLMVAGVASADLTVDEIIANIQSRQGVIEDMSADTVTKITSSIKGAPEMTQKGKILTKYPDKSRVEVFSPAHQVTITDGSKVTVIDKTTGQRYENEMAEGQMANSGGQADFEKAKEYFNFEAEQAADSYIITGTPRDDNKLIGKMEFYVNAETWQPKMVKVYTPAGQLISQSELFYTDFDGIPVMTKNISTVSMPQGQMRMEMSYENVKVNQGVDE